ncbi:MAG: GDP-mannose 4,6-dehydratase [Phycisphaerae bacterium]|nr:GDP-mannose 4,6-dehydratase [Phycisphaerae bacterium]
MDSILITGGAGFIGSNFVRTVMRRYPKAQVYVLDALTYAGDPENLSDDIRSAPRFHFWYGNVCNADLVSDLMDQVETVVHFAAETHVARSIFDNWVFFQTDVMGTHVIANQVLRHRKRIKRFVHISTSEVYGTAVSEPMDEGEHPLIPMSPYASAKCGADRLVYSYWKTYGIPAVIVRPFNQYGPRQHLEKCVPRFVTSALTGEPLTIHGDGSAARDWVYVDDTCRALIAVLEAPLDAILGEVVNIGTGVATDVLTIARKILDITGGSESLLQYVENRPGQVDKHIAATEKASRLLKWKATTDLDKGLSRTIEWYEANEAWWRKLDWMKQVELSLPSGQKVLH